MTDPVFHHCYFLTSLFENTNIFAQIFSAETKRQQRGYIKGAPGDFGDLGRMAIYFQGAGEHW